MSITQQQAIEALERVYSDATHAAFTDRNLVRQYIEQGAQTHKAEDSPSDGELLDWLEAHLFERKWSGTIGQPSGWYMAGPYRHTMQHMRGESLRAAIRAAIAQESKA